MSNRNQNFNTGNFDVPPSSENIDINDHLNRLNPDQYEKINKATDTFDHILFFTLDTLRADHLSLYDYPLKTSPFLDRMAEESLTFDRAFAPTEMTVPSHTSMLTGLYPLEHRILKNGHKLHKSFTTVAELLSKEGYQTHGFVSTNRHFKAADLNKGFNTFDEPDNGETQAYFDNEERVKDLHYRPAEKTLDKAINFVNNKIHSPSFIWIHLFDPHNPYVHRDKHIEEFSELAQNKIDEWKTFVRQNHHFDLDALLPLLNPYGYRHREERYNLYDSEVHYMDKCLEDFFSDLDETIRKESFKIFCADHGEGLGLHRWWGHGKHIYNEQIRVPLIINSPNLNESGQRIEEVVELNDLFPTILSAAGVGSQTVFEGRETPVEGTPLQSFWNEVKVLNEKFGHAFAQRRVYEDRSWHWKLFYKLTKFLQYPEVNYERGNKFSLLNRNSKYIYQTTLADEFYDLKTDFYEQENTLTTKPTQRQSNLATKLKETIEELQNVGPAGTESVAEETVKGLKNLGYLQ